MFLTENKIQLEHAKTVDCVASSKEVIPIESIALIEEIFEDDE